jgi:YfiH family protein
MQLLHFDIFKPYPQVQTFITTRQGGVSQAPFDSLNLSYAVADTPDNVNANRQRLATHLGISVAQFCIPKQTHSANIHLVTKTDIGKGSSLTGAFIEDTDGLITHEKGACLMVFSADCVLTLLYDTENQVIGAVHGGWRGTVTQIAAKAVAALQTNFGTKPENLRVGIAPAIRACCYEVGEEVTAAFRQNFSYAEQFLYWNSTSNKYHLDLHKATQLQLQAVGVAPENIEVKELCTYCHVATFFSSRHGKGITGRFGAGIFLR